jgi:hypothetical protein
VNEQRVTAFKQEIGRLKLKGASNEAERVLLAAGVALLVAGIGLAILGAVQVLGTNDLSEQMGALVSGSLLGLALIGAGVALFLRYSQARFQRFWLIRLLYEQQSQTDRIIEAFERLSDRSDAQMASDADTAR